MIRIVLIIILAIAALPLNAQDLPYFKRVVKELSSARYRPEYDMYFVAFSGEDANLRGSTYFAVRGVPCIFLENEEGMPSSTTTLRPTISKPFAGIATSQSLNWLPALLKSLEP